MKIIYMYKNLELEILFSDYSCLGTNFLCNISAL